MASVVAFTQASTLASTRRSAKASSGRTCVVVRAQQQPSSGVTRREATLAVAAAALATLSSARPAQAIFGLGDNKKAEEEYTAVTNKIITEVLEGAQLPKDTPNREERLRATRDNMNAWVARYRRDQAFSGRPSYGNTYSAVNALAGHLNSFGYTNPVPKKRLERMVKELGDAQKLLERGR